MGKVEAVGIKTGLFCVRVEWALKLKGVDYEYIEDIRNKSPLLLKLNLVHKKLPVLVQDGNPIAESLVILEYIDEMWKDNPLLPQDPYQKASACFWAKYVEEKVVVTYFSSRSLFFSSLNEWSQNFIQIPAIKQCLPPREILVDYFQASISYVRSLNANAKP